MCILFTDQNIYKANGDPWNGILKFSECKDKINQQIELKEWIKKVGLKFLKNKSCLIPELWLLKRKT